MKKFTFFIAAVSVMMLAGCGNTAQGNVGNAEGGTLTEEISEGREVNHIVGMANPWRETDLEGMQEDLGLYINAPEGAMEIRYSIMDQESMGQMDFVLDGVKFCARIQPQPEFADISGMFYTWDSEATCEVAGLEGKLLKYNGEGTQQSGEQAVACLWMDMVPGIAYSLSATGENIDSVDIISIAEQVYIPMQGEN